MITCVQSTLHTLSVHTLMMCSLCSRNQRLKVALRVHSELREHNTVRVLSSFMSSLQNQVEKDFTGIVNTRHSHALLTCVRDSVLAFCRMSCTAFSWPRTHNACLIHRRQREEQSTSVIFFQHLANPLRYVHFHTLDIATSSLALTHISRPFSAFTFLLSLFLAYTVEHTVSFLPQNTKASNLQACMLMFAVKGRKCAVYRCRFPCVHHASGSHHCIGCRMLIFARAGRTGH